MNKNFLDQIEERLDLYFGKKAPIMPENVKKFMVKYFPYLIIFILICQIPGFLISFGLVNFVLPFTYINGIHRGFSFSFSLLFSLFSLVLVFMALSGLFKRSKKSWKYLFYASLITAFGNLLSFKLGDLIINGIISFYILFQIRSYYKN